MEFAITSSLSLSLSLWGHIKACTYHISPLNPDELETIIPIISSMVLQAVSMNREAAGWCSLLKFVVTRCIVNSSLRIKVSFKEIVILLV
jgi:hypothetical protein